MGRVKLFSALTSCPTESRLTNLHVGLLHGSDRVVVSVRLRCRVTGLMMIMVMMLAMMMIIGRMLLPPPLSAGPGILDRLLADLAPSYYSHATYFFLEHIPPTCVSSAPSAGKPKPRRLLPLSSSSSFARALSLEIRLFARKRRRKKRGGGQSARKSARKSALLIAESSSRRFPFLFSSHVTNVTLPSVRVLRSSAV